MKTPQSILSDFEKTAEIWRSSLEHYSEEQFSRKPDGNGWSIGQVYNHLVGGTRRYQLRQIAACLDGKGTHNGEGKTISGMIVFALGRFLPARIKVPPSDAYTPKQPGGIQEIRAGLHHLIEAIREAGKALEGATEIQKTRHFILGALNAREWYQLTEMHFRHHLRQKGRLDQFLAG